MRVFLMLVSLLLADHVFAVEKGGIKKIEKSETEFCNISFFSKSGEEVESPDGFLIGATFTQKIECEVKPKKISTNTFVILNPNTVYKGVGIVQIVQDKKTKKEIKTRIKTNVIYKNGDYVLVRYPPIEGGGKFRISLDFYLRG